MRCPYLRNAFIRFKPFALLIALLPALPAAAYCQSAGGKPIADVFEVMSKVDDLASLPLWPGFDPRTVPTAVFDGANTYLFRHPAPQQGFEPVEKRSGVYRFAGKHPQVFGNARTKIGNVMTATSILSPQSKRSGETYTLQDLAGIIIHEQFHVFQAEKHPNWRPNDAYLLVYPLETLESLSLRMTEKEAFRRAVDAKSSAVAAGWAKEGLKYRKQRLAPLGAQLAGYEMELQRFEGISEYIEMLARGRDPQALLALTSGIAPSGVRDLGYVEGRLISVLLDRFDKTWKDQLESGRAQYPEELLASAVSGIETSVGFDGDDLKRIRSDAGNALAKWNEEKKQLMSSFSSAPGVAIEIVAESTPLNVRMFEPLAMENLGGGEIFHKVFFSAGNDKGTVRVRDNPCISYMDSTYRLTRVTITGLEGDPAVDTAAGTLKYDANDVTIDFKGCKVTAGDRKYTIEL